MKVSRNDPCPCGSGKKYKKCCLSKDEAAEFSYRRVRQAIEELEAKLRAFSVNELGEDLFEVALNAFLVWNPAARSYPSDGLISVSVPWMLFAWVLDKVDVEELCLDTPLPMDTTIAEFYAQQRGLSADSLEAKLIGALSRPYFSFYEVLEVHPGTGAACQDILTGTRHFVRDIGLSRSVEKGKILYGAIPRIDDLEILLGAASIVFPISWKVEIVDFRARFVGTDAYFEKRMLHEHSTEIRDFFLNLYKKMFTPPLLCNTDGEPLCAHTLYYDISDPMAVFDALHGLSVVETREELLREATFDQSGDVQTVTIPWSRLETSEDKFVDNTLLGRIHIDGLKMRIEVNSEKRAERIKEIVTSLLGEKALYRTTSIESINPFELFSGDNDDNGAVDDELLQDPEITAFLEEKFLDHWTKWVDTPLPVLGGQTPRSAIATRDGREKVEALLRSTTPAYSQQFAAQKKGLDAARKTLGLE